MILALTKHCTAEKDISLKLKIQARMLVKGILLDGPQVMLQILKYLILGTV